MEGLPVVCSNYDRHQFSIAYTHTDTHTLIVVVLKLIY